MSSSWLNINHFGDLRGQIVHQHDDDAYCDSFIRLMGGCVETIQSFMSGWVLESGGFEQGVRQLRISIPQMIAQRIEGSELGASLRDETVQSPGFMRMRI